MLKIFEEKNNTVAFVLVIITASIYSSLGLISAVSQSLQNPFLLLITYGTLFAVVINYIFLLKRGVNLKKGIGNIMQNQKIRKLFYIRLLLSTHTFFTIAGFYLLISKNLGVLMYEMHPIISIVFSYFILKENYKKNEKLFYSWILISVATIGILLVSYQEIYIIQEHLFEQSIGLLLILIATIFRGLIAPIAPKMNLLLEKNKQNFSKFDNALIIQFLTLICILPVFVAVSMYFYEINISSLIQMDNVLIAGYLGIFIIFGSAVLHNIAGSIANTHNIYLGYYIAPVIGIILLWGFGYSEINSTIVLSLILILVPNLLLNLNIEDSFSFKATFIWILLFAIVLFYYQGKPIESETYFNSANALLVFFALMIGYLINKLNERSNFREKLFMQFLHKIRGDGVDEWAVESISAKFQQANNRLTDKVKDELSKFNINTGKYSELLDFKFIQNRRLYNVGELFVLLLISLLLIGITTVYRDNSFLYDSYAFIVNTAVVFTLAQVVERMFFSEYEQQTPKNILMKNTVSMLFLIVLIIAIVILFSSKHNFNI